MSFGYAVGDFLALTQLAWRVVENSRKACGAHAELTREATSLHIVLQPLEREVSKPRSILNQNDGNRRDELAVLSGDCNRVLRVLSRILEKYNALSDEERSVTKLWQRIRFGNGEMQDLNEIRLKVSTSTSAITLFLNLLSIGSQGRVEEFMESQDEGFKEMRQSLNYIAASLQVKSREGSILTSYAEDDKKFWKEFRRELIKEGFPSAVLSKHKPAIKAYVMELGNLGALDDIQGGEQHLDSDEDVSLAEEASSYHSSNLQTTDNTQAAEVTGIFFSDKDDKLFSPAEESILPLSAAGTLATAKEKEDRLREKDQREEAAVVLDDDESASQTSESNDEFADAHNKPGHNHGIDMREFQEDEKQKSEDPTSAPSHLEATFKVDPSSTVRDGFPTGPPAFYSGEDSSEVCLIPHPYYYGIGEPYTSDGRSIIQENGQRVVDVEVGNGLEPLESTIWVFGSDFEINSLCDWIVQLAKLHEQSQASRTQFPEDNNFAACAQELKDLLLRAKSYVKRTRECMPNVHDDDHRKVLTSLILGGRDLFDYLVSFVEEVVRISLDVKSDRYSGQKGREELARLRAIIHRKQAVGFLGKGAGRDFVRAFFEEPPSPIFDKLHRETYLSWLVTRVQELIMDFKERCEHLVQRAERERGILVGHHLAREAEYLWKSERLSSEAVRHSDLTFEEYLRDSLSSATFAFNKANEALEDWKSIHTHASSSRRVESSWDTPSLSRLLKNCDFAQGRLTWIRNDLDHCTDADRSGSKEYGMDAIKPQPQIVSKDRSDKPQPNPSDQTEGDNKPPRFSHDLKWIHDLIKRMKKPIEWESLISILRENGVPDTELGVRAPGGVMSQIMQSSLIMGISTEAQAIHGGQAGSIVISKEVKKASKKARRMGAVSTTHVNSWIPPSQLSSLLKQGKERGYFK